jgi:dienelactone hydrolase
MYKKRMKVGNVPVLMLYKSLLESQTHGVVIFYHGFTAKKELNIKEYERLAEQGYLVVGVDNYDHGERIHPDFKTVYAEGPHFLSAFLNAVEKTAEELPALIDALIEENYVVNDKIALVGISMGGFITYSALTKEPRVRVAVPFIGSPNHGAENANSPHLNLSYFKHVKLLSLLAAKDDVVPPGDAVDFHDALKDYYDDYDERFKAVVYPQSGHFMSEVEWELAMDELFSWLKRHMC